MGKRIISQRRGTGTRRYIALTKRSAGPAKHPHLTKDEVLFGEVLELIHSPGHSAPLARIQYSNGETTLIQAAENMCVGDILSLGKNAPVQPGNTLPLAQIPDGTEIYNIEQSPGDGGKFVRASGVNARVLSKIGNHVTVKLPSKKEKTFHAQCRATIGIVAGGGRKEKPLMKAGKNWHAQRARGRLYPVTAAVAMNAVEHPFGSGRGRHKGKPSIAPRHAPPGRKVGKVKPRRTGYRR